MKYIFIFQFLLLFTQELCSQTTRQGPCSGIEYRQFDFWIGEWEAFSPDGKKAGDSRISVILDSCVLLEEWTSVTVNNNVRYAGKSFNRYNSIDKNWQQTWVDNFGLGNEYLKGSYLNNQMILETAPFIYAKDSLALRKMTFTNLGNNKIRQFGEISKDGGKVWALEFDLEYRKIK
ncbi:MAG: hypothetical protein IPO78_13275 [Saprospiraceae bacterium]|nr:hypothetical protein [Saprospiraceae bacterium]